MRLTAATLSFTLPTAPGTFEFRFFVNDTFTRLATSNTFTASAPQAMLSAFPSANMPGGAETVSVSGGPGNLTDWVGLYRPGDLDVNPIDWQYLSGTRTPPAAGLRSATLTFTLPATAGVYEFRFFQNDSYSRLATSGSVTVGVVPTVTVTPATIGPQGTITVTVTGGPGNPTDWLGLAAQGSDERILLDWEYLNGTRTAPATGVTTATLTFIAPSAPGTYVVKLYANDNFNRVATSNPFQVQ